MPKQPNCDQLTWKANGSTSLNRPFDNFQLWDFLSTWLDRFEETAMANVVERFIFLWVSVNAWAAKSVTDLSKNHEDAYLVHCMSNDNVLSQRFLSLYQDNQLFKKTVDDFIILAPIFQVIWLQNHGISPWNSNNDRHEFVQQVFRQNPYIEIHRPRQDDIRFAAFAPLCAHEHLMKGELIPSDWRHILAMIYQVRCNLFHGGKNYYRESDRLFIRQAYSILWEVWKAEVPNYSPLTRRRARRYEQSPSLTQSKLPWRRIFIRSGFRVDEQDGKITFSTETEPNKQYFKQILEKGEFGRFDDNVFFPKELEIDQMLWLDAVDKCHSGAEGGSPDDIYIMDTYMAGLVRWINEIGISTNFSCDGNGEKSPIFIADDEVSAKLAVWLLNNKDHQFIHSNRTVKFVIPNHFLGFPRSITYLLKLLDYAEWLYDNKANLIIFLKLKQKIVKDNNTSD